MHQALHGAASQIRTGDLILTKDALYRLSYSSISQAALIYYHNSFALSRTFFNLLFFHLSCRTGACLPFLCIPYIGFSDSVSADPMTSKGNGKMQSAQHFAYYTTDSAMMKASNSLFLQIHRFFFRRKQAVTYKGLLQLFGTAQKEEPRTVNFIAMRDCTGALHFWRSSQLDTAAKHNRW